MQCHPRVVRPKMLTRQCFHLWQSIEKNISSITIWVGCLCYLEYMAPNICGGPKIFCGTSSSCKYVSTFMLPKGWTLSISNARWAFPCTVSITPEPSSSLLWIFFLIPLSLGDHKAPQQLPFQLFHLYSRISTSTKDCITRVTSCDRYGSNYYWCPWGLDITNFYHRLLFFINKGLIKFFFLFFVF